jgi:hypothetical protein
MEFFRPSVTLAFLLKEAGPVGELKGWRTMDFFPSLGLRLPPLTYLKKEKGPRGMVASKTHHQPRRMPYYCGIILRPMTSLIVRETPLWGWS